MKPEGVETAARLKLWRADLKLSQQQLADLTGVPLQTLKGYELAHRQPGADALAAFAKAGVNLNWLLTGEGSMRVADAASQPADFGDTQRLTATVAAVEEGLRLINRRLPPEKYAQLVAAAYQLMPASSTAQIVSFIGAAAA